MALDGAVAGYFDARDALRPDAAEAGYYRTASRWLAAGVDADWRFRRKAAEPIARQAGITEVEGGMDPGGKVLARIRALQASGLRVAMVGGWNQRDAAALAQADAGIAMGSGADLASRSRRRAALRAQPKAIPAVGVGTSDTAYDAPKPGLGGWLQPAQHPVGCGLALPRLSHLADPVACGSGNGA